MQMNPLLSSTNNKLIGVIIICGQLQQVRRMKNIKFEFRKNIFIELGENILYSKHKRWLGSNPKIQNDLEITGTSKLTLYEGICGCFICNFTLFHHLINQICAQLYTLIFGPYRLITTIFNMLTNKLFSTGVLF